MDKNEGAILRQRRLELGMTQMEVARESGIELQHYQQFEYGVRPFSNCRLRIGLRICAVLELDPFEFILS